MSCVVGITDGEQVWLGADSAGVAGYQLRLRRDRKIFRRDDFLFGFAGSFRMGQLLKYNLELPTRPIGTDLETYIHTDLIDACRLAFLRGGFTQQAMGQEFADGFFLMGHAGKLYCVQCDFQVEETTDLFMAIGCGSEAALGSLYTTQVQAPEERIRLALEAAEHFSAGVRRPFFLLDNVMEQSDGMTLEASAVVYPIKIALETLTLQVQAAKA